MRLVKNLREVIQYLSRENWFERSTPQCPLILLFHIERIWTSTQKEMLMSLSHFYVERFFSFYNKRNVSMVWINENLNVLHAVNWNAETIARNLILCLFYVVICREWNILICPKSRHFSTLHLFLALNFFSAIFDLRVRNSRNRVYSTNGLPRT